jgi:restriction system protein
VDVWVIRAGKVGEREEWCFANGYAGGGFNDIDDLSSCASRDDIKAVYRRSRPTDSDGRVNTNSAQLWLLRGRVKVGDLVVLPLKGGVKKIAIGKCAGTYTYLVDEVVSRRHIVKVNWEKTDIPRSAIKQDLLYILGSALSFFNPKKNDAAWRIEKILATGVDPGSRVASGNTESRAVVEDEDEIEAEGIDVVEAARDVIRSFVIENFKGHKLADLTAAILEARGLTCVVSPPGPDKGIDILAGSGPLGLDEPRIVVQCKSEVSAVGSEVVQKLLGAIGGVAGAQQGLLVAFGGINGPAKQLLNNQQFRVKVWDTDELIDNLLDVFENLDVDVASEIPLQRVWTLSGGLE